MSHITPHTEEKEVQPTDLSYGHEDKKDVWADDVKVVNAAHYGEGEFGEPAAAIQTFGLHATVDDIAEAEDKISGMSLERCMAIMTQLRKMHKNDQNFPGDLLWKIDELLDNPNVAANPEKHETLIHAMKLEALLVTENSPYAMVRSVVDNTDDPTMPSLTFRVWFIGIVFSGIGIFINQLFDTRLPSITVTSDVGQLLAYPLGKLMERILPRKEFRMFGQSFSLNPGPFNKKEHMLITIMCTVGFTKPYTTNIILAQALPIYFNQAYARTFSYQLLNTLASNFVGYGLAGLARRFIVYPSYCVWPASLSTLALNKAFHSDDTAPVAGPFKRFYYWSRLRFFTMAFIAMFIWFWFPGFIITALSYFNWMSWIAPNNIKYNAIVSVTSGLGVNPWPTFDFNLAHSLYTPLILPLFTMTNQFVGMILGGLMIVGFWWSNAFDSAYLPINSNHTFDHKGKAYNVSKITNKLGIYDAEKYKAYSQPYMAAGNLSVYFWFFATYSSTVVYVLMYNRAELAAGFVGFWREMKRTFRRGGVPEEQEEDLAEDIHFRLMKQYKEVPEWWYMAVLLISLGIGIAGVAAYDTGVTPVVVIFGIIMAIVAIVPVGLIQAVTGGAVTLNVIAEFIGGSIVPGNALSMNYFKMYGYITTAYAINFCKDLKMAHYTKIPPRHTFIVQIVGTLVATFIASALFNFQMSFEGICTKNAVFGMSCPGENTFFTAAIFWGILGPHKIFGNMGRYRTLLIGFPVGAIMPPVFYLLQKKFPRVKWLRSLHPVMICAGALGWAPYNLSYAWSAMMICWFSWGYMRGRYLAFWGKYNFVLSAAWASAMAICGIVIFFAIQLPDKSMPEWWGIDPESGCSNGDCPLFELPEKGYFGPDTWS